jgi:hypothetical protein
MVGIRRVLYQCSLPTNYPYFQAKKHRDWKSVKSIQLLDDEDASKTVDVARTLAISGFPASSLRVWGAGNRDLGVEGAAQHTRWFERFDWARAGAFDGCEERGKTSGSA